MKTVFLIILILAFSGNAYAYIDPGTGSLILQGLLAAVATATTVFGIYYAKIKNFFSKKNSEESQTDQHQTSNSQEK